MGETIDRTRVEIAAQRAELEATVADLRAALDIPARVRENPLPVIGLAAGVAFLVVGGPRRVMRLLRARSAPRRAQEAYDALPGPMQAWVDALAQAGGASGATARAGIVEELRKWRREPVKDRKARQALARQMVEGPPGPQRTAWVAAEAALMLVAGALARKAIERFLTREADRPPRPIPASAPSLKSPSPAAADYAGISSRGRGSGAP